MGHSGTAPAFQALRQPPRPDPALVAVGAQARLTQAGRLADRPGDTGPDDTRSRPDRLSPRPRPVRRRVLLDDGFAEQLLQYDPPAVGDSVERGNQRRGM